MTYSQPVETIIRRRYSVRSYQKQPLDENSCNSLAAHLAALPQGPFGTAGRFQLVAATQEDRSALRGLGTYGFIKDPPAFVIGAAVDGPKVLEDFGYQMEVLILFATDLGLGTCWLGGTFTRSAFARKVGLRPDEIIPAAYSIGYPTLPIDEADFAARQVTSRRERLAWEALFFDESFGVPLSAEKSGAYTAPLEMVRIGPSASNKQPWRIIRQDGRWHFYMQRTPGYRERALLRFMNIADMQRIDMGIAMCHFELAAREAGLQGRWEIHEPEIEKPDALTEYVVSWTA